MPIPREKRDRRLRFQLDSGREHPPHDMITWNALGSTWKFGKYFQVTSKAIRFTKGAKIGNSVRCEGSVPERI
eukprot:gene24187-biopygen9887